MDWGRLDEAKDQLNQILRDCPLVSIIVDYVTIKDEVTKDNLRKKIGTDASVSRARRFKVGINALMDMLTFSGLLQEEDDRLKLGKIVEEVPPPEEKGVARRISRFPEIDIGRPSIIKEPAKEVSIPISLTFNITEMTDIEKLREVLRAIKEELLEEQERG